MLNSVGATAANQLPAHLHTLGMVPGQIDLVAEWSRYALDLLELLFNKHPFLFGDKPSIGDFGLMGPLYAHLGRDPWSKRELIDTRPSVRAWVDRMNEPHARAGAFMPGDALPETLTPIFRMLTGEFLPMVEGILREVKLAI